MSEKFNIAGTPTILFNGWRVEGSPSRLELARIVEALKKGERPFGKDEISGR